MIFSPNQKRFFSIWDQHGDIAVLEGLNGPPIVMLFNPKYFETV
jgi:hypothetical protein